MPASIACSLQSYSLSLLSNYAKLIIVKKILLFEQNSAWSRFALVAYCLNCTKFEKLIFRKVIKIDATMSYFKAKMHKIRFPLGLRPRPRWGSLQRSPDPLSGYKGAYI